MMRMQGEDGEDSNMEREISELKQRTTLLESQMTDVKINNAKAEEKTSQLFSLLTKIEASIEKIANRLDVIEDKPAQRWEQVVKIGITVIGTAVFTLLIVGLV
ncbi:hypothetical protein [Clostridium estertheticum]|uniref:hypothetical protein n=1 Tax=Clostridium estertheticum TaxID=238834 RepID=UPI001C0E7268|nr:hypothetical protein [Clostridium estertheticum]MBU3172773.1 hypothetical protein [Clostridium estertheticum]